MDPASFFQSPLGAAVLVIAAYALKLFLPRLAPLVTPLLKKLTPATPTPADPVVPLTPAPATPRPLLDAAVDVLKQLAMKKFPWMTAEYAMVELARQTDKEHDAKQAEESKQRLASVQTSS